MALVGAVGKWPTDTRGTHSCIIYGKKVIEGLTSEDVALLQDDPNFCKKGTLSALRGDFSGENISRGQWLIDEANNGASLAHISMCIKENRRQTLASLAFRVAFEKRVEFSEAADMLQALRNAGMLFYYEFEERKTVKNNWTPGNDNSIFDAIAKYQAKHKHKRRLMKGNAEADEAKLDDTWVDDTELEETAL